MAKHVLTNVKTMANAVDLSDHVESVEVNVNVEDVDVTAMGATAREHLAGLRDDAITLNFYQDFAAAKVDATFWPLIGSTPFTVVITPVNAAVSSTNPSFTASCILLTYSPLAGSIGEANKTSISLPCNGAIVRATT